jgi:hypothetical protein
MTIKRELLKLIAIISLGAILAACQSSQQPRLDVKPSPTPTPSLASLSTSATEKSLDTETPYPSSTPTNEVVIPSATRVPTEAPTATATPEQFSFAAISFVPKSIEEIGQSVEVRSPIDDPEGYKEDIDKVIAVIHDKILPNYQGEFLTGDKQQIGVGNGNIDFYGGAVLNPVASVYFNWEYNGTTYKVPRFFFPARDSQGEFTLSMVFNPTMDLKIGKPQLTNPAPDWSMADIIKRFPMQIKDPGYLNTFYSRQPILPTFYWANDAFFSVYLQEPMNDLGGAYWGWIVGGKPFDRSVEDEAIAIKGGM